MKEGGKGSFRDASGTWSRTPAGLSWRASQRSLIKVPSVLEHSSSLIPLSHFLQSPDLLTNGSNQLPSRYPVRVEKKGEKKKRAGEIFILRRSREMGSTVLPVAIEKRSLVGGSVINRLILRPSAIRWAGEARGACDLHPTDDWLHPRISVCVYAFLFFFFNFTSESSSNRK